MTSEVPETPARATPHSEGRRARALVLRDDGTPLGCLPTVDLDRPWWSETNDLISAMKGRYGLDAVVVRLLRTSTLTFEPGAEVTYALEATGSLPAGLPLVPCDGVGLDDGAEPLRMPWARVGGVAAALAWADNELRNLGRRRTGSAEQMKSWNLSLLVRLPTEGGTVWLKQVPPFFRHESAVIALARNAGADVPNVIAADSAAGLALLDEIPGQDTYSPNEDLAIRMVESFVTLQYRMTSQCDAIFGAGGPDWRAGALLRDLSRLAARHAVRAELEARELVALDQLIRTLPARLDALYACGLEDTLVHGDFSPGNHRFDGRRLVLLDWGDSGVGHPLLDMAAFVDRIPFDWIDRIRAAWTAAWNEMNPRSDVTEAASLIQPIAALRQALIYRGFLDRIETSERVYHTGDPALWLRRAIAFAA